MSWLSRRETTRVEDMAYCVLGLFDINMPLLYGEGHKAFIRLQEEIIRSHQDHSIFCWSYDPEFVPEDWTSMLAPRPRVFADAGRYTKQKPRLDVLPYSVTNLGLSIPLPVLYTPTGVMAVLDAADSSFRTDMRSCILLKRNHSLAKIFRRIPFPREPVDIRISGSPLPRADLFIQSKPEAKYSFRKTVRLLIPPGKGENDIGDLEQESFQSEVSQFSIVLFLDPSATKFFFSDSSLTGQSSGSESQGLLATRSVIMSSAPRGSLSTSQFDSVLRLFSRQSLSSPQELKSYHASLLTIGVSGSYDAHYLFFAVYSTAAEPTLYCDIRTEKEMFSQGYVWPFCSSETLDSWMWTAHRNWRENTSAKAKDGLQLTLGDPFKTAMPGVYRPATLSRGKDTSL